MTELKKLSTSTPQRRLTFSEGLYFGLGFWTAAFLFSFVIIPALLCGALIILSALGMSMSELVPPR